MRRQIIGKNTGQVRIIRDIRATANDRKGEESRSQSKQKQVANVELNWRCSCRTAHALH